MRMGHANISLHETERRQAGRYVERHGLVTSYDPKTYLAKVTFQPEGQESGWLPIETGHIGNGFGIAIGLTPGKGGGQQGGGGGSGGSSGGQQQDDGDQVIVRYQEGDIESGKIVQRVHSDKDKPPKVEAGEMVFWHKNGAMIFFSKDGSLLLKGGKEQASQSQSGDPNSNTDNSVASYKLDGKGNITVMGQKKTDTLQSDHSETINGDKKVTIKGKRTDNVSKIWQAVAQFGHWSWLTSGSDDSD
jgi:phage baseplate assembly protein gpV